MINRKLIKKAVLSVHADAFFTILHYMSDDLSVGFSTFYWSRNTSTEWLMLPMTLYTLKLVTNFKKHMSCHVNSFHMFSLFIYLKMSKQLVKSLNLVRVHYITLGKVRFSRATFNLWLGLSLLYIKLIM